MDKVALSRQVRENFAAKAAFPARVVPGVQVLDRPDSLRVDCGLASDTFNVVLARDLDGVDLARMVRTHVEYFRAKRFPMAFWVWDSPRSQELAHCLEQAGLSSDETDVAMAADLRGVAQPLDLPDGFTIRAAASSADHRDFGGILSGLFEGSPESHSVRAYYDRLSERGLEHDSPLQHFLGFAEGKAVCTGALFLDGENAGIYDLATLAEHRRKGFGSAVFRFLLQQARQSGYRRGVLQASPDGLGIYRREGFQPVGNVRVFEERDL